MAEFLNTSEAYGKIESIVRKAHNHLVLITPFIKMADSLLERLIDRAENGVKITIVCREADLKTPEKDSLKNIKDLDLRFLNNLHAKCFYNEDTMVITSLNLYETSQENREMGILVTLQDDPSIFNEALEEAKFIIRSATKSKPNKLINNRYGKNREIKKDKIPYKQKISSPKSFVEKFENAVDSILGIDNNGFCIRCHDRINKDISKPLCKDCHEIWRKVSNPAYTEKYCHNCGKSSRTSFAKPLCRSCYDLDSW